MKLIGSGAALSLISTTVAPAASLPFLIYLDNGFVQNPADIKPCPYA